jgi:hypothetical protein
MVRNVFAFRTVNSQILRNVVYSLKEMSFLKNTTVLKVGEYCPYTYFIKKGQVKVYV